MAYIGGFGTGPSPPTKISQVKLVDVAATTDNDVLQASISIPADVVTPDIDSLTLEWNFETLEIGETIVITYEMDLNSLVPGERRLVGKQTVLTYQDQEEQLLTHVIGDVFVDVLLFPGEITIDADRVSYLPPEQALLTVTLDTSPFVTQSVFTTAEDFETGNLINLDADIDPGSLLLAVTGGGVFASEGTASFVIDAGQPARWGDVKFSGAFPAGTGISIRTRSAPTAESLAVAAFSDPFSVSATQVPSEDSLFLEIEVVLSTQDTAVSPRLDFVSVSFNNRNLAIDITIEDAAGNFVDFVSRIPLIDSDLGQVRTFFRVFETDGIARDDYVAIAALVDTGTGVPVTAAEDGFEILGQTAEEIMNGSVATDRRGYTSGNIVLITSKVSNDSNNVTIDSFNVVATVLDPSQVVAETFEYEVNNLVSGALNQRELQFDVTRASLIGEYTVVQTVDITGFDIFNRNATFDVIADVLAGQGISGTIGVQPAVIPRFGDLGIAVSASNTGNVSLTDVTLQVDVVDPDSLLVVQSFSTVVDFPTGKAAQAFAFDFDGVNIPRKSYPVSLTANFVFNGESISIPLDVSGFSLVNTPPVADAGDDRNVDQDRAAGTEVTLDGSGSTDLDSSNSPANDNDIVSYEWSEGVTALGEGKFLTLTFSPGTHIVALKVTDTFGAFDTDEVVISVLTPKEQKEGVLDALVTVTACPGTSKEVKDVNLHIQRAVEDIRRSLNLDPDGSSDPWKNFPMYRDTQRLDLTHGHMVFDFERQAVHELAKAVNDHPDNVVACALQTDLAKELIPKIVAIDRVFALIGIAEAEETPAQDPDKAAQVARKIAEAQQFIIDGDAARDGNDNETAIHNYRQAWQRAGDAIALAN